MAFPAKTCWALNMSRGISGQLPRRLHLLIGSSTWRVNAKRLRDALGARDVRLATEAEIANLFPDCQVGTMPPFGNLYGVEVYVGQLLTEDESIVFEAWTYVGAIKLRYKDFADLVRPKVAAFHHKPSKITTSSQRAE